MLRLSPTFLLAAVACCAQTVNLSVPVGPTPVSGGGKTLLVYELHITNNTGKQVPVDKIEVLDGARTIESWEGAGLKKMLGIKDVSTGIESVAFLWIALDPKAPVPHKLHHRVTYGSTPIEGGETLVSDTPPVVLGPPLSGANWIAANGPSNSSAHRRALLPIGGKLILAQRFAIDWVQVDSKSRTFTGNAKDNKSYHAYGTEALAVADAVVSIVKDGIPENTPGENSRAVPITLETVGGNHIVLNLGDGRYAFYAHLQPGSMRVKVGDHVRKGQPLALVGNSGNSTEPHLHFHVVNGNSGLGAEGLPYGFESFHTGSTEHRNEIPVDGMKVSWEH